MQRTGRSFLSIFRSRLLLSLYSTSDLFRSRIHPSSPIATTSATAAPRRNPTLSSRDYLILEKFRRRRVNGESNSSKSKPPPVTEDESISQDTESIYGFQELGLSEEAMTALENMYISFPTEIQTVAIPAMLEGKSVVMGSLIGSGRTLSYMLCLTQMLLNDKCRSPRAVVLCADKEYCEKAFSIARFIGPYMNLSSTMVGEVGDSSQEGHSDMIIGTPLAVLRCFELGHMDCSNINFAVFDDADVMYQSRVNVHACKLVNLLRSNAAVLQAVMVTGPMIKVLGERQPAFVEQLERDHSGVMAAVLLEMDLPDLFPLLDSLDALRDKIVDAMESLRPATSKRSDYP